MGVFLVMITLFGKAQLFLDLSVSLSSFAQHSNVDISFVERLLHYSESVQSMLFPSNVYIEDVMAYGVNLKALFNTVNQMDYSLSIVGIVVIVLALIGFLRNRNKSFTQIVWGGSAAISLSFQ